MIPFVHIFENDIFANTKTNVLAKFPNITQLYYEYGHPLEIINTLAEKTQSNVFKYKKYPLIMLFQDLDEEHNKIGYKIPYTTIIIATPTNPTFKAKQRYDETFIPILYPIYESLIKNLEVSTFIGWDKEHTKIDRVYWGKNGIYGNTGNIFNDFLDAIEVNFKNLRIIKKC